MKKSVCPTCGAKMQEYKHTLNIPMVSALRKLEDAGGHANLSDIGLTVSQHNNFQKLQYFELAYRTGHNGTWAVSELGRAFLSGESSVAERVTTYRGTVISKVGRRVFVRDINEKAYKQREDYAASAKTQGSLFS